MRMVRNSAELENAKIPKCSGKTNSDLGNRVTHAFKGGIGND